MTVLDFSETRITPTYSSNSTGKRQPSTTKKPFFSEFLAPGAKAEINIDSQTMELTKQNMKTPTR